MSDENAQRFHEVGGEGTQVPTRTPLKTHEVGAAPEKAADTIPPPAPEPEPPPESEPEIEVD